MPDSLRFPTAILRSRFGRRLFVMFCIAALLPTAIVFWMTYRAATDDARQARHAALREGGKNYALGVYDRLHLADRVLAAIAADDLQGAAGDRLLSVYFSDLAVAPTPVANADAGEAGPEGAGVTLLAPSRPGQAPALRRIVAGQVVTATLDPYFLWGDPTELGQDMRICMYAGRVRLYCGGHPGTEPGDRLVVAHWPLFLKARFGAGPWTVVAVAGAAKALVHYRDVLVPATIAVLLFAVLLSSVQIRHVLVPLSDLLRRIQRFEGGQGRLDRRRGEDEFDLLSRTFGRMQQRIGRQMDTLRILSDIDRLTARGAPLQDLLEQVALGVRQLSGCRTVCVVVAPAGPAPERALYVLSSGARELRRQDAAGCGPALPAGGWLGVEALHGGVRQACCADGAGHAFVLQAEGRSGHVQVVLGFDAVPEDAEGPLAQAAKVVESVPVALALEEGRRQLVFQAEHDPLTRLPNRAATLEAVEAAIARAAREGTGFAVTFLDLDRFKAINDALGHGVGDALLVAVADRIRANLAPGELVGRFGGDEFCMLLPDAATQALAERAVQRIANALLPPVHAAGREFAQRFSAGIALYPAHGADASTLIRNADVAMYHGKRAGGRALRVFAPAMNDAAHFRLQLEQDLRRAVAEGAIDVHYQPRVDSRDGRIVGAEALARWTRPGSGPVPAQEFIALAEDAGLIDELGELVMRKACRQLAEWAAAGVAIPSVAVNVSSHQLRSRKLAGTLRAAIADAGIAPSQLEIEITESMLVHDREGGESQLQRIGELGVGIAIDDFGTGYSSLSYLVSLPFDTLKIDRAFVLDLGDGATPAAAIVRAVVGLARELGKDVVAEGVEAMEDVRLLAAMGCHTIQGYAFHRPMPADELTAILRQAPRGA